MMRLRATTDDLYKILVWSSLLVCLSGCNPSTQATPTPMAGSYTLLDTIDLSPASSNYSINDLAWSPTGDTLAIVEGSETYIYSIQEKQSQLVSEHVPFPPLIAWKPEGSQLAGGSQQLWIWDSQSGDSVTSSNDMQDFRFFDRVFWSHDGQSLVTTYIDSGARTSTIERWDVKSDQLQTLLVLDVKNPYLIDWGPDDQIMAVGSSSSDPIWIVDVASGRTIKILAGTKYHVAGWSPDGTRFAAVIPSGDIVIWDTASWQIINTLLSQGDFTNTLRWAHDGAGLVASGHNGVILWNANSGESRRIHQGLVKHAAWAPDGKRLATAVEDKVYIWDITQLP